jgi:Fe2+ or Zn2+ uptake regulation protein
MTAFRKSKQRQMILDLLSDMKTHPTAQEIFARAREIEPELGQATVYRNLRILKEQGTILELSFGPGAKRYDHNMDRHEHFTCSRCGKIEDIYPNTRSLIGSLSKEGYRVDEWRIEAFGVCQGCAQNRKPKKSNLRNHAGH